MDNVTPPRALLSRRAPGRAWRRSATRLPFVIAAAAAAVVLTPALAFAGGVRGGGGSSLGAVNGILIFAVIPLATMAILALLCLRPGSAPGAQRYRPGREWKADPIWFGVAARRHHEPLALGAAHDAEHTPPPPPRDTAPLSTGAAPTARIVGGSHGSW